MIGVLVLALLAGAIIYLFGRTAYPIRTTVSADKKTHTAGQRTYKAYTHDSKGITGLVADAVADAEINKNAYPLVTLVDGLGGFEVSLNMEDLSRLSDEKVGMQPEPHKGEQKLNGIQTIAYARKTKNDSIVTSQLEKKCAALSARRYKYLVRSVAGKLQR